jgi:hypothetical protein
MSLEAVVTYGAATPTVREPLASPDFMSIPGQRFREIQDRRWELDLGCVNRLGTIIHCSPSHNFRCVIPASQARGAAAAHRKHCTEY